MKSFLIKIWAKTLVGMLPTAILAVFGQITQSQNIKDMIYYLTFAMFCVGLMYIHILYKIDCINRIVTKDTDQLTQKEIKDEINLQLRFKGFQSEVNGEVQQLRTEVNEVKTFDSRIIKLNDRTYNDLRYLLNLLSQLHTDVSRLGKQAGYEPIMSKPDEYPKEIKHSSVNQNLEAEKNQKKYEV